MYVCCRPLNPHSLTVRLERPATYTHTYTVKHTWSYIHTRSYIHTWSRSWSRSYIHGHTYTVIHTRSYIHTWSRFWACSPGLINISLVISRLTQYSILSHSQAWVSSNCCLVLTRVHSSNYYFTEALNLIIIA